jgi:hypothetical protein
MAAHEWNVLLLRAIAGETLIVLVGELCPNANSPMVLSALSL